jgi:glycosyltransferase involved in cell wall biosynthesis
MLDFDAIIRRAVRQAGAASVSVAVPFETPKQVLRELAAEGIIGGYIADSASDALGSAQDPSLAGWWIDRAGGLWCLKARGPDTILFLGARADHQVGGRMLLEARLKGIRRLLLVGTSGEILREVDTEAAVVAALDRSVDGERLGQAALDDAFEELYSAVGDRLRLPPESFVAGRALLLPGNLGPGGAERQASYTAVGLKQRTAYDVYVGCNHLEPPSDFFKPAVEAAGARVVKVTDPPPGYDSPEILEVRNRLSRYDAFAFQNVFQVVYGYAVLLRTVRPTLLHTWMDYCNVLGGTAAELVGVPHRVLSGRSVAPDHFRVFQPYMRPGYDALLRRKQDIVFLNNSAAGAADYSRWLGLPPDRVRVVHNGFEFPSEVPWEAGRALRVRHGVPEGAIVVGSVLRFAEEKRPRLLVEMARVAHQRDPELRFLFFGTGPMLDEVRAYVASLELSDIIKLPGLTHDAWSALAAMDVFALTSRMEGLPNVLVEAQASGLPVVCTGVGGMAETFAQGVTGFSVERATPEALADAIRRIVTTPDLLRSMSAEAFRHARETFGLEPMVSGTLDAYRAAGATIPAKVNVQG